jgi:hypothetical protein
MTLPVNASSLDTGNNMRGWAASQRGIVLRRKPPREANNPKFSGMDFLAQMNADFS